MKKRPASHVTDSAGIELLRRVLPEEWVVREYQPDYGIDFAVEVFDSAPGGFVTLGEHFFIQLKSHSRVKWITKKVHPRYNVEKAPLTYNRNESMEIHVISESLEVAELRLARSMGPAAPLLLAVADLANEQVNWVCLNDFADKVLVPEVGEDISTQATHTVHLPKFNRIERTQEALIPLRFIARRAKLYAAFNRFRYQRHEIQYALERYRLAIDSKDTEPNFLYLANHFLGTVLAYDFWETTYAWPSVEITHKCAENTARIISGVLSGDSLETFFGEQLEGVEIPGNSREEVLQFMFAADIESTFAKLANLGNMFEEICREWYLPTYLGTLAEEHAIR